MKHYGKKDILKNIRGKKSAVGDFWVVSYVSTKPFIKGGKVFKDPAFYDKLPDGGRMVIAVDFAYSTKTYSDYSVAGVGKLYDGKIYLWIFGGVR